MDRLSFLRVSLGLGPCLLENTDDLQIEVLNGPETCVLASPCIGLNLGPLSIIPPYPRIMPPFYFLAVFLLPCHLIIVMFCYLILHLFFYSVQSVDIIHTRHLCIVVYFATLYPLA